MIHYHHTEFPGKGKPRYTIAGIFDLTNLTLRIGIARCSEKDNFSKSRGRFIAEKRAGSLRPSKIVIINEEEKPITQFLEIAKNIISDIEKEDIKIPRYKSGEMGRAVINDMLW